MNESTKDTIPVDGRTFVHRLRSWRWWLLALAWMGGIYFLSAQSNLVAAGGALVVRCALLDRPFH